METNFSCGCLKTITINHNGDVAQLRKLVEERGWVVANTETDKDGVEHIFPRCSSHCHNEHMRHRFSRNRSVSWWKNTRGFNGKPPDCTCSLVPNENDLLLEKRNPTCPWHQWLDNWRKKRNEEEERLFEQWKAVPVGTLVFEQENVNKSRGRGLTTGPAKIVWWTFGGHCSTMIPVEDWGPHPRLENLTIVEK